MINFIHIEKILFEDKRAFFTVEMKRIFLSVASYEELSFNLKPQKTFSLKLFPCFSALFMYSLSRNLRFASREKIEITFSNSFLSVGAEFFRAFFTQMVEEKMILFC